jgi:hypothetical protein
MSHFFIHERGRDRPIHFWSVLGVWKSINLTVVQMFFIDRNCNVLPLRYCIDFFSVNGNFSAFLILILQRNTYFIKRKLHYKLALDTELRPSGPFTGMSSMYNRFDVSVIYPCNIFDKIAFILTYSTLFCKFIWSPLCFFCMIFHNSLQCLFPYVA